MSGKSIAAKQVAAHLEEAASLGGRLDAAPENQIPPLNREKINTPFSGLIPDSAQGIHSLVV
jgi:hypothetical protein